MRNTLFASLALAIVSLGILACGGEEVVSSDDVAVRLGEYTLEPDAGAAPAGVVKITGINSGALEHDIWIIKTDLAPGALPVVDAQADLSVGEVFDPIDDTAMGEMSDDDGHEESSGEMTMGETSEDDDGHDDSSSEMAMGETSEDDDGHDDSSGGMAMGEMSPEEHAEEHKLHLQPGERFSASFDLPPGSYVLLCNIATHYQLGMYAAFTVN